MSVHPQGDVLTRVEDPVVEVGVVRQVHHAVTPVVLVDRLARRSHVRDYDHLLFGRVTLAVGVDVVARGLVSMHEVSRSDAAARIISAEGDLLVINDAKPADLSCDRVSIVVCPQRTSQELDVVDDHRAVIEQREVRDVRG